MTLFPRRLQEEGVQKSTVIYLCKDTESKYYAKPVRQKSPLPHPRRGFSFPDLSFPYSFQPLGPLLFKALIQPSSMQNSSCTHKRTHTQKQGTRIKQGEGITNQPGNTMLNKQKDLRHTHHCGKELNQCNTAYKILSRMELGPAVV